MPTLSQAFKHWFNNGGMAKARDNVVQSVFVDSGHGAAYLDIFTTDKMTRITLWNAGHCDREVLSVETGKQIFYAYTHFCEWASAQAAIEEFLQTLI